MGSNLPWMGIAVVLLFLLLLGGGGLLIAFVFGGGKITSGKKAGIGIGLMAFGMFFLVCLGAPLMWDSRMESAESQYRTVVKKDIKQLGKTLRKHDQRKKSDQFGKIPIKPKTTTAPDLNKSKPHPPQAKSIIKTVPPPMPKNATSSATKKHHNAKKTIPSKPKPAETTEVKQNIKIETPPDWIQQTTVKRENKTYLVLHSDEFATTAEAEVDLLQKVKAQFKKQFIIDRESNTPFRIDVFETYCVVHGRAKQRGSYQRAKQDRGRNTDARYDNYSVRTHGHLDGMGFSKVDDQVILTVPGSVTSVHLKKSNWHLPDTLLQQTLKRQYDETVHRRTDKHEFKMHRAHAQILITEKELAFTWQVLQTYVTNQEKEVANLNIWKGATLLGMLTLLFGTITTYLRVDTLTNGAYRNRLRFAGAGLVTLGTSIGIYLMRLV